MTAITTTALRTAVIAAAAGLLLAASGASAQTSIPGGAGPGNHPGHGTPIPLPAPQLTVKPYLPPPPPFEPGLAARPDRGGGEDGDQIVRANDNAVADHAGWSGADDLTNGHNACYGLITCHNTAWQQPFPFDPEGFEDTCDYYGGVVVIVEFSDGSLNYECHYSG